MKHDDYLHDWETKRQCHLHYSLPDADTSSEPQFSQGKGSSGQELRKCSSNNYLGLHVPNPHIPAQLETAVGSCSCGRSRCLKHSSKNPFRLQNTSFAAVRGACRRGQLNPGQLYPVRGTRCHRGRCRHRKTGQGCWRLRCSHRWRRRPCNSPVSPQPHCQLPHYMSWEPWCATHHILPTASACRGTTSSSVLHSENHNEPGVITHQQHARLLGLAGRVFFHTSDPDHSSHLPARQGCGILC